MDKYKGHTPGPWRVDEEPHETGFNHVSIKWDNWTIASVLVSGDESMTNAKLIADAPMLAERVEELEGIVNTQRGTIENYYETTKKLAEQNAEMLDMIKIWESITGPPLDSNWNSIRKEMRELIARTEG